MKRLICCLIAALILSSSYGAYAQIKYIDGKLMIGNVSTPHYLYDVTANINSVYMYGPNNCYLKFFLSQSGDPMLAGIGNKVAFYDTETQAFNNINVSHVIYCSDARIKTDIMNFDSGMEVIQRLRPVSYNFRGIQAHRGISNQYTGTNAEIGLLAQELEEVLPNLVYTDEDGKKLVDYISLIPALIDAVQTLCQDVETLKSLKQ